MQALKTKQWKQINAQTQSQITADISPIVKQYLASKNIITDKDYQRLILVTQGENDANLIKDATKFVQAIQNLAHNNQQIVVYGDYDCDGFCATTVALRSLRAMRQINNLDAHDNYHVGYFINTRTMGYGIQAEGIDMICQQFPQVRTIITVDNGVVALDGIRYAINKGLQVLVTDHHEPLANGDLPPALAICDIKRKNDSYPFKGLSGTGVIYKLMELVAKKNHNSKLLQQIQSLKDLVGLSIVSDSMPLLDENRLYVQYTLDSFNKIRNYNQNVSVSQTRFCKSPVFMRYAFIFLLKVLFSRDILNPNNPITTDTLGWYIAPIFNAISRVTGKINFAVDVFNSTDKTYIITGVQKLVDYNLQRQDISNRAFAQTQQHLADTYSNQKLPDVIISVDKEVTEGIVGLIAGKITNTYHHPSIVLTQKADGNYAGSARSINGVSIINVLRSIDNNAGSETPFLTLGGHAGAAGMTIKQNQIDDFIQAVLNVHLSQNLDNSSSTVCYDIEVDYHQINYKLYDDLQTLSPFGQDLEEPVIKTTFTIKNCSLFGRQEIAHVKYASDNFMAIEWQGAQRLEIINNQQYVLPIGKQISIIGTMKPSYYNHNIDVYIDDIHSA